MSGAAGAPRYASARVANLHPALVAVAVVALIAVVGAGAYLAGRSTGEDLGEAREQAAAAGEKQGAELGKWEGYRQGFRAGRERGFGQTYAESYREAYFRQFENAELKPPERVSVPGPRGGGGSSD